MKKVLPFIKEHRYFSLFIMCMACALFEIFGFWKGFFNHPPQMFFACGFVFVIFFAAYRIVTNNPLDEKTIIFLIFVLGFLFRLTYIHETSYLIRQHDVGGKNGHYEYIMKFFNHQKLPDINIKSAWQYYQPPVWHYICALFLHIQVSLGIAIKTALENLQLITLFCSSAIMLVSYKLFKLFGIKKNALIIAFSVIAFHPTFIILSGSINNDVLSLLFALVSVYLAVKWYREPKFSTILLLALSIGFSMGVKLSGGLISVGVAVLFAIRLFGKKINNKLNLIGQFASFGVLCVPIALWWQVRNYIKFGIPFTYVPMLSNTNSQYIGFRSTFERLFDFSSLFENGVYPARAIESKAEFFEYYEYNIPLGALKTSVFGEYYIGFESVIGRFFANILFYSALILVVISLIGAVYLVVKAIKNKKINEYFSVSELYFILICHIVIVFSYIKFCFEFAHFCTMDFRYIAMTVVFGALYLGLLMNGREKNNKMFDKVLNYSVVTTLVLFAVSSIALYVTVG